MLSINQLALKIAREMIMNSHQLGVTTAETGGGATVIDLGVKAPGGWAAAKSLVEIGLGGLGLVTYGDFIVNSYRLSSIDVYLDKPELTSRFSQLPRLKFGGCLLAGPGQAVDTLQTEEGKTQERYTDQSRQAVFYLETEKEPEESFIIELAKKLNRSEQDLYLLIAAPTSLASVVYRSSLTASLIIEQLTARGIEPASIAWAWGTAPIAPLTDVAELITARKRAALEKGGSCSIWLRSEDASLAKLIDGFQSVAQVNLHNLISAKTWTQGIVDQGVLSKAFFE